MKHITILLIALLSLASSCQKDDPFTPDWHTDVFRCKVNGVDWKPECQSDPLFGCDAIDCQYYWEDTKGFEMIITRNIPLDAIQEGILLFKYGIELGENELQSTTKEFRNFSLPSGCRFFDMNQSESHKIFIIKIDSINHIIEGTFEFTAINECQDTVRITDGYFDVNFRF